MKALVNSISRLIAVLNRSAVQVVGHGRDRPVRRAWPARASARRPAPSGRAWSVLGVGVDDHPPGPAQEPVDALDALHAPGLDRLERAHEHLVEPQAVGAVLLDDRRRG